MDEKDYTIYKLLNENGRTKLVEIARKLGFSHPSAKERMEKLFKNEDIKVKALLNIKKKKWKVAVCNMRVENMGNAVKLADIFKKCPRVVFIQTMTGAYNLLLIAVGQSTQILEYFIETELRSRPEIKKLDISIGDAPVYPEFFDIKIPEKKLLRPPCGINYCPDCYLYNKDCEGCPASIHWRGINFS
jgi:DNA-binding Lrp family transcriptional regulator